MVAGIQLTTYWMVTIGGWIEMPRNCAKDMVQEILMSSLKNQSQDGTTTAVPAQACIAVN